MSEPYLHIYSPQQWHDDAYIVGNTEGLIALRDAINRALGEERKGGLAAFVNDGEGFYGAVVRVDDKSEKFDLLAVPYVGEEYAKENRENAIYPHRIRRASEAIKEQDELVRKKHEIPDRPSEVLSTDDESHSIQQEPADQDLP